MSLRVVPITLKRAEPLVAEWHRHLRPPQGGLFAAAVQSGDRIVGVGIAGRPHARMAQTGWRIEVTRVATDGTRNACSMLYGALSRAAAALGYCEIVTKTLISEPGSSLRAAGFEDMGEASGGEWDRPSRSRRSADEPGPKRRWRRRLCVGCDRCPGPASEVEEDVVEEGEGEPPIEDRDDDRDDEAGLRPFFCFYGGKWRAAPYYPAPEHGTIVEPFAGAAGYATRHHERRVVLVERDPIVAGVWRYLLRVSPSELRAIPDVPNDGTVDELRVCEEARHLVGFWLNKGTSSPCRRPSAWMRGADKRWPSGQYARSRSYWGPHVREQLAAQVERIRHWTLIEGSYEDAPDVEATWFVDPPYEQAGEHYRCSEVDRRRLADFVRSRRGLVVACEAEGASWLPFVPFRRIRSNPTIGDGRSSEAIFVRRSRRAGGRCWSPTASDDLEFRSTAEHQGGRPTALREGSLVLRADGAAVVWSRADDAWRAEWFGSPSALRALSTDDLREAEAWCATRCQEARMLRSSSIETLLQQRLEDVGWRPFFNTPAKTPSGVEKPWRRAVEDARRVGLRRFA